MQLSSLRLGLVAVGCVWAASASAQDVTTTVQELTARTDAQAADIAELKATKSTGLAAELEALSAEVEVLGAAVVANSQDIATTASALHGIDGLIRKLEDKVAKLDAARLAPPIGFVLQSDGTYRMLDVFVGNGPTFVRENVDAGVVGFGGDDEVLGAVADLLGGDGTAKEECWDVFSAVERSKPLTTPDGVPVTLCAYDPKVGDAFAPEPGEISIDAFELLSLYTGRSVLDGGGLTLKGLKIDLNP